MKDTIRFVWRDAAVRPWPRDDFTRGVIMGMMKLTPAEVFCLQDNVPARGFDVTMTTGAIAASVLALCRSRARERPLCFYEAIDMARQNMRWVTVTMFGPHVPEPAIAAHLGRFGAVNSVFRPVKDVFGFFVGRRQCQLLLGDDPEGVDGLSHPPARFAVGAIAGRVYYDRQPPNCRRCQEVGHGDAACPGPRCRGCGARGHMVRDCTVPKACHGCGVRGHLWRGCPTRARSYAAAAGGSGRAPGNPGEGPAPRLVEVAVPGPAEVPRPVVMEERVAAAVPVEVVDPLPEEVPGPRVMEELAAAAVPEEVVMPGSVEVPGPMVMGELAAAAGPVEVVIPGPDEVPGPMEMEELVAAAVSDVPAGPVVVAEGGVPGQGAGGLWALVDALRGVPAQIPPAPLGGPPSAFVFGRLAPASGGTAEFEQAGPSAFLFGRPAPASGGTADLEQLRKIQRALDEVDRGDAAAIWRYRRKADVLGDEGDEGVAQGGEGTSKRVRGIPGGGGFWLGGGPWKWRWRGGLRLDRKSTRLNSSH